MDVFHQLTENFDDMLESVFAHLNNFSGRKMKMAFAETFKALSDSLRRQILELLKKGPLSSGSKTV